MAIKHPTPLLDQLETGPAQLRVRHQSRKLNTERPTPTTWNFRFPPTLPTTLLGIGELSL